MIILLFRIDQQVDQINKKQRYAHEREPIMKLVDMIQTIKPSFLIDIYLFLFNFCFINS
jgi:hypothetical protein